MPTPLSYPGVFIEEQPGGIRTIAGVPTSITAFIGRAVRGPVNHPTAINSFADFERLFGGLWASSSLGYAVRDFFHNGGAQAVIVRLFAPTHADEKAQIAARETAAALATRAADTVIAAAITAASKRTPAPTAATVAAAVRRAAKAASAPGPAAKLAAGFVAARATTAQTLPAATATSVKDAANAAKAEAVATATDELAPATHASLTVDELVLSAANAGSWGNALRARIDHQVSAGAAKKLRWKASDLFNLTVRDSTTGVTEVFRDLTVLAGSPRFVGKVLAEECSLVRVGLPLPGRRPPPHRDPAPGGDAFAEDETSAKVTMRASDGKVLTTAAFTGPGLKAAKQGLYALDHTDIFNLLCIPPYTAKNDTNRSLIDSAIAYCKDRRAFLIIDPPSSWTTLSAAKNGVASEVGAASSHAAVFFPRLIQPDPLQQNLSAVFAPCGAVAGVFARTDALRGVWKAPAGAEASLAGFPGLRVTLTNVENEELNRVAVNCLRAMPRIGPVIWGARTRAGDDRLASEYKYIPVRRLALFIEESIRRGTQWAVFERNDEPLWAQIRLNVDAFLHGLFRQGAFQGRSPKEAYFVKCGRDTTTQSQIDLGIINIVIGFAPIKPAEFVVLTLQQAAGETKP